MMVSAAVVDCPAKFESPEYVAVTVSEPTGALVAVQLLAGSVAVQSVVLPVVKVTVPVALVGSVEEYVTDCPYTCGDGSAAAVNALTVTASLLVAGSPSVEEIRAMFVTVPLNPSDRVTGTVMTGSAVPAAIGDSGVYVQLTV